MTIIKELLFPKHCLVCGALGSYLCDRCYSRLSRVNTQTCLYCFKPSLLGLTHPGCKRKFGVDGFITLYKYGGVGGKLIKRLKYKLVRDAFNDVLNKMREELSSKLTFIATLSPLVVPIPLHQDRLLWRGFNQSEYVAKFISRSLNFNLSPTLLRRKKRTLPQFGLTHLERARNLKGAFILNKAEKEKIREKTILLVDDIVTSGHTVREAALVLKRGGAKNVFVFSIARG